MARLGSGLITLGSSDQNGARDPFAIAVQHHKTEHQIPERFAEMWDTLRTSDAVQIENVSHWNMGSKRMEAQARWGDVLVTLGGSDGVLFLANLYHDAGKPVVPLNFSLCAPTEGSLKLFDFGLASSKASGLFRASGRNAHAWMNRINHSHRIRIAKRVEDVLEVLEAIERPKAFAVRLLNPNHGDFDAVGTFYQEVVKTFVEDELGYGLVVVDGRQPYEYARIDEEIFRKLHRSSLVIADLTGSRPNCYLELGYALGRGLQTMVTAKAGTDLPFDIATLAAHHWEPEGNQSARINALREHWAAIEKQATPCPRTPIDPMNEGAATYISVDVETSGPIPGEYSLLSIGACNVYLPQQTFECKLKPNRNNAVPAAMEVTGLIS